MSDVGFLGAGTLYVDRENTSGVATGLLAIGNATKFEIKPDGEIKERPSMMKATYGQNLDTVSIPKPQKISITIDNLNMDNLALALLGSTAVLTQNAGSINNESVTTIWDRGVDLAHANIDIATAIVWSGAGLFHDSGTSTIYEEGADYTLTASGILTALSTGAITENKVVKVEYSWGAIAGQVVSGATTPRIIARLKLDGMNYTDSKNVIVNVPRAMLQPTGPVNFISKDFESITLEGTLITATGQTTPYTIQNYASSTF